MFQFRKRQTTCLVDIYGAVSSSRWHSKRAPSRKGSMPSPQQKEDYHVFQP